MTLQVCHELIKPGGLVMILILLFRFTLGSHIRMQVKVSCKSLVIRIKLFLGVIAKAMGLKKAEIFGNQWLANKLSVDS